MKKLITMAVAILITGFITAFAANPPRQFNYQVPFSKIVVADDIDLELTESTSKTIEVTGDNSDVEKVDWEVKGDVLYLQSKKGTFKEKVKVSVSVNQLKEILIEGESQISSVGVLHSPALYIYMEDDCAVAVKNTGSIYVVNGDYTIVEVKKLVGNVQVGR